MHYKLLGKSGLRVSELALGTMTFGEDWGWAAGKKLNHSSLGDENRCPNQRQSILPGMGTLY